MKRLYIDVETTGRDSSIHGIIQISGIIEIDGAVQESFDFYVKPFEGDVIEDEALACNNITREQIEKFEAPNVIYKRLVKILSKYVDRYNKSDKFVFLAFNSIFDNDFLRAFFLKNEDKYFGSWFWNPDICILRAAMSYIGDERPLLENMKLFTVAEYLGISLEKDESLHNSSTDVRLAMEIYKRCNLNIQLQNCVV